MSDKFTCLHSGKCCELITTQINISFSDVIRISKHTSMSFKELFDKAIGLQPFFDPENPDKFDAELGLGIPCFFRQKKRCIIYDARPLNCRIFPYYIISTCPESELKNVFDKRYECIFQTKLDSKTKRNYKEYADRIGKIIMDENEIVDEALQRLELNIPVLMKMETDRDDEEAMNSHIKKCKSLIKGRLTDEKMDLLISVMEKMMVSNKFTDLKKIKVLEDKYLKN
ncbi:YkgJ family cysteine cluster protein [Bacteroidota bacterium]